MDLGQELLSQLTIYSKYAKYIPELQRRETWEEIVSRNLDMHKKKYPHLASQIEQWGRYVREKKVLGAMRGYQFGGRAIERNPSRQFNCLRKSTSFVTSEGPRTFEDFKDGDEVTVLSHKGYWRKAIVKSYGVQKLNKITITRGRHLHYVYATAKHRWILKNGTETISLSKGDLLLGSPAIFDEFTYESSSIEEKIYWAYGFIFGDGSLVKDKNGEYARSMVRLCDKKRRFIERFRELGFKDSLPLSARGDYFVYTGTYLKTIPDPHIDSPNLIRAFVAGYLDADGGRNNCQSSLTQYNSIVAKGPEHQYVIENLFPIAGIVIYLTKDISGQITNYGERKDTKYYSISSNVTPRSGSSCFSVKSIEEDVLEEEVWCLEVEYDHSFVLTSGEVTGNCSYTPINNIKVFSEIMFLLLSGCGVGYGVQFSDVEQLPEIKKPKGSSRFLIGDSIEGWSDAIRVLIKAYFEGSFLPSFDFSDIRPRGTPLKVSGGKAPGSEPLKQCLLNINSLLKKFHVGDKVRPIHVHDIVCHIANSVLSGGIRRSSLIALFSIDDEEMLHAKHGRWWEVEPQRAMANNSAVMLRYRLRKKDFEQHWKIMQESRSGDPGFFLSNNKSFGLNPCAESSLRPFQFCNLCEINGSTVENQKDFNNRAKAAAFFGTLQAGYTDFHYLREVWRKTTEKDALLGIGITGIASGTLNGLDLGEAALSVAAMNSMVSKDIGINPSARMTLVKPSGTSSCVLGTSSGIHAWHSPFYLRRMRFNKQEAIFQHLLKEHYYLTEHDNRDERNGIVTLPIAAPAGAITREHEKALDLLERVAYYHKGWVIPGHAHGDNTHSISATVNVRDKEWEEVGEWMWEKRDSYNNLSIFPWDGGTHEQTPFEEITEEEYKKRAKLLQPIDFESIREWEDNTELRDNLACAGDNCSI